MKKKILAMTLIAAMALIPATACAEVGGTITKSAPDDAQIQTMPQGTPAYARHDAAVKEVADGSIMLDIGEELPETATIDENTIIFTASGDVTDISAVKAGEKISVFVDGDAPVPAIYPAQYPASYVVIGDGENYAGVDIDVYNESDSLGMYLNGAKNLAINVDENSSIIPADGTKIHIDYTDLAGRELAVFYSNVTMSIPGQTYPDKIVVLSEPDLTEIIDLEETASAYVRKDAEILSASKSEENGIEVKTLEVKDDSESEPYRINVTNAAILDNSGNPVDIFDENFHNVKISAFIDVNSPAPAINPPLYYADAVIVNKDGAEGNYDVDVYTKGEEEGSYVNSANSLVINTSESTSIVPSNATKIRIDYTDLDGRKLVVFYTNSTRSIPAQTNPDKIVALVSGDIMEPQVVLDDKNSDSEDSAYTKIIAENNTIENFYNDGTVTMVPLRAVAEGLGFTVGWNGENQSVTISDKTRSSGAEIKIGDKNVTKEGDMVFELDAAPVIIDDYTYIPLTFFETVLNISTTVDHDNLIMNIL